MFKNPVKNGLRLMRSNSRAIHRAYGASDSRTLHLAGISGVGNILLGLGKIASGILSLSVFVCINGLYTLGMVLARYCALAGAIRTQDAGQQYGYYRRSGMILIAASLLYICYSMWSFFHPKEVSYHMYVALAIATFTFAEIGVNLYGMIANRKNAAALISLVLTQSAILSFAGGEDHDPAVNALMGMLSGTCAALLGVFMLWRIGKLRRRETNEMGDISYDPDTGGG